MIDFPAPQGPESKSQCGFAKLQPGPHPFQPQWTQGSLPFRGLKLCTYLYFIVTALSTPTSSTLYTLHLEYMECWKQLWTGADPKRLNTTQVKPNRESTAGTRKRAQFHCCAQLEWYHSFLFHVSTVTSTRESYPLSRPENEQLAALFIHIFHIFTDPRAGKWLTTMFNV